MFSTIQTKEVKYHFNGKDYCSYAAFPEGKEKPPIVLIIPEWWGLSDYMREQAKRLAELGYLAFAIDMYGDAYFTGVPEEAKKHSVPFYGQPEPAKSIFEEGMRQAKALNIGQADNIAAIGYCFGGAMALNMARIKEPLKGVVSIHGNLLSGVKTTGTTVPILVLHGNADTFVPETEVANFKKEMNEAGVNFQFIGYPDAVHSFTNPTATESGKKYNMNIAYNETATKAAWKDMANFLQKVLKN